MAKKRKGMWCGFKQPFLWGERCVTSKRRLRRRLHEHKIIRFQNIDQKLRMRQRYSARRQVSILVPRGCDPFGQRHGSRPLAGSNFQSAIHGLPIFLRSLVPLLKCRPGNKFWTRNSKFQRHHIERKTIRSFKAVSS